MSIYGELAIVGAHHDLETYYTAQDAGVAYIFQGSSGGTNNWGQIKKLTTPVRRMNDNFGTSVSISGDYAIVGASGEDYDILGNAYLASSGSAYIFEKNVGGPGAWGMMKKITSNNRTEFCNFGSAVSISGSNAIIGSLGEQVDELGQNPLLSSGAAYIVNDDLLSPERWASRYKLTADVRFNSNIYYGYSVSLSGDYAVVGAPYEPGGVIDNDFKKYTGAAYVLRNNAGTWTQVKKLSAPLRDRDSFGSSVSIDGEYIIVGSPDNSRDVSENNYLLGSGSPYIYRKDQDGQDNWGLVRKITAHNRKVSDGFGGSVAINGEYAVVGSTGEDEDSDEGQSLSESGAAYIFKRDHGGADHWEQIEKITASDRSANDGFGARVSINGSRILVGAPWDGNDLTNGNQLASAGSAYIFEKHMNGTEQWNQIQKLLSPIREAGDIFGFNLLLKEIMQL